MSDTDTHKFTPVEENCRDESFARKPSVFLSRRDRDILSLIADGKTDADIALILRVTAKTVNYHVESIKARFGVSTRIQAVVTALRCRYID